MSVSGPEALHSLEEALRDVRREEDEIAKRLARSAELVAKTRETEGELFGKLAALRLEPGVQAELTGRLSAAEVKARSMQKAHGDALQAAEDALGALDAEIAALNAERGEKLDAVKTRQAEMEALRDKVSGGLAGEAAYIAAKSEAAELEEVAAESLHKTTQAEADREVKGRPYRDDPLFMYLWERGYGTGTYKASNLIRYLDGLVARLVGFHKARPNFAMLNEIPLRLREHAEHQAENAAVAQGKVAALEDAAIDAAGGKPVRAALAEAESRIAAIDARLVEIEDQRDEATKKQQELAQGKDPAYAEALSALAEALGREDLQTLLAEARATQTGQDDTIISQIDAARARAAEEERENADQKERLKTLASRRRELEDIQFEFKKSRFDDPRSSFGDNALVGDMLTEFLRGGISAARYWQSWQGSQHWSGGSPASGPWGGFRFDDDDDDDRDDDDDDRKRRSGWPQGGFSWPDNSFGGGSSSKRNRSSGGGFGGSWGRLPTGGGSSGGFSRPRTGSIGTRSHKGFKTGGGI